MKFQLGIERWLSDQTIREAGAIGLVSHDAARLCDGRSTAEALVDACGTRLRALFGPEHGFAIRGGAGEPVAHARHPQWDIPVWSLYGEHRKPTPDMLQHLDVIVVDLHTLPFRPYTYLATLLNVMQAAGEQQLPVVVADRPLPLPDTLDGPLPAAGQRNFICPASLPMAYGMTLAETARWLHPQLDKKPALQISAMTGYQREATPQPNWPPWVSPSPAIRSWSSALCYLISVFCEALPLFGNDRHGPLAFQVLFGPPAWDACRAALIDACDDTHGLRITPADPEKQTQRSGIRFQVTDPRRLRPVRAAIGMLAIIQQALGIDRLWHHPGARPDFFDRLFGTPAVREGLQAGKSPDVMAAAWRAQQARFTVERNAVLLY